MKRLLIFTPVLLLAACSSDSSGPSVHAELARLAVGTHHACLADGPTVTCWGRGLEGQLGVGATPADSTAVTVTGAPALASLALGGTHSCGLDADGAAWCWGSNQFGEITDAVADLACGAIPCRPTAGPAATGFTFQMLVAGLSFTCGLARDGRVYCWGLNDTGQLGNEDVLTGCGGLPCSSTPVLAAGGRRFRAITAGQSHVCGLDAEGTAWCWGYEALPIPGGHPNPSFLPNPRRVTGAPPFSRISAAGYHTCALTGQGIAWCWGIDALGAGPNTLESAEPVRVSGNHRFQALATARYTTCGIEESDVVFCWGPNGSGEVGNEPVGSSQRFDDPAQISGSLTFSAIAGGGSTYCGMTTLAQVACWGRGIEGELGSGHANSTTPVLVPFPLTASQAF